MLEEVGIKVLVEPLGERGTGLPPGHLGRADRKIHVLCTYFCKYYMRIERRRDWKLHSYARV